MNRSLSLHRHGLVILCLVFTFPSGSSADPGKEAKQPFARILKELQSPDAAVRAAAAEKLLSTTVPTDKASIISLGRLLVNKDYTVASAAETALKRMGGDGVPALADLLLDKESTPELRRKILLLFQSLGPRAKNATTALLQLLHYPDLDENGRYLAGEVLKAIGPHAVPMIVRTFPKCDEKSTHTLIESLEHIIGEDMAGKYRLPPPMYRQVIPLFVRGLGSRDQDVRIRCARGLAMLQIDKREWILSIAKLIKEDDLVRKTDTHSVVGAMDLASVLGTIGPPARCAGPYLKSLLDHPHNGIRWYTIVAATMIGLQDEFADPVIRIAKTCRHFEVREQAVRLLGQVSKPTDQVIEALEKRFQKDENKFVRLLAAHSLTKLNPKHARARAFILRCTRDAKNRDLRAMAVRLLATVPGTDDQILAALADRLDDPEEYVCLDVAETIGHLGKKANKLKVQIETAALTSPHVRARPLFAAALIRVDPKNATAQRLLRANLATVKDMLLMPEKQWRLFGVEVIGLMDVERAAVESDIRKRVKDEDPLVREAAGRVLKNLKKRSR